MSAFLRRLDFTPDDRPRKTERTLWGAALTVGGVVVVLVFAVWFSILFVTETTTVVINTSTLGRTYVIPFRCVSSGGCNATYEYGASGPCAHLAGRRGLNVSEGEIFTMDVCRSSNPVEGVRVRSTFEVNNMWVELNRLWIVELVRGEEFVPVGKTSKNEIQIAHIGAFATTNRANPTGRQVAHEAQWNIQPTATILFDSYCFSLGLSFTHICGGTQFTLADTFVEEKHILANNFRTTVLASVTAVVTCVSIAIGLLTQGIRKLKSGSVDCV